LAFSGVASRKCPSSAHVVLQDQAPAPVVLLLVLVRVVTDQSRGVKVRREGRASGRAPPLAVHRRVAVVVRRRRGLGAPCVVIARSGVVVPAGTVLNRPRLRVVEGMADHLPEVERPHHADRRPVLVRHAVNATQSERIVWVELGDRAHHRVVHRQATEIDLPDHVPRGPRTAAVQLKRRVQSPRQNVVGPRSRRPARTVLMSRSHEETFHRFR
jgi:hypothetical protein